MRGFWLDRPWHLRLLALAVAGLVALLALWAAPGAKIRTEESVGDLSWRLAASTRTEQRLVVLDIDERAVQQEGAWPWPRATLARVAQRLAEAGAAVQVYDIVFPEPKPGDAELAAAWAGQPVVLAQIFSLDPTTTPALGQPAGASAHCPAAAAASFGVVANSASLMPAGAVAGHLTPRVEIDGVVRKVPALICHDGRGYATLSLAALSRLAGAAPIDWQVRAGQGWLAPAWVASSPALPGIDVPLDSRGDLRVPFGIAREAMRSVSAADLLAGRADPALLRGAVVLVGATAFGIGDVVATPLASVASGVEVHAQLLAGLLDGRLVQTPAAAPALEVAAALSAGAVLLGMLGWRPRAAVKLLPLVGAGLALLLVAFAGHAQTRWGLWLPWSGAALFALLASITLAAAEHALTRAQRERLSAHLGAYLPAPMAARLAAIDPSGRLEVERRQVTVLVADIRNFSAFALHQKPEETAAVLHAFSCLAVDIIERHGGVVENLVGDSVVAMWNAYADRGDRADHGEKALAAARELLREATTLLAATQPDPETSTVQPLALGIGLESGDAIVGSFGPARRRAHAALGEPVTVAVRLQAMTQDLSLPILIGPQLAAALPAGATVSQGEYLLEGLSRHSELHVPAAWADWAPAETVFPPATTLRLRPGEGDEGLLSARPLMAAPTTPRDL